MANLARELEVERVLALTATATPEVVADICKGFGIPAECALVTGFHRPNLELRTTPVTDNERASVLIDRLRNLRPPPMQSLFGVLADHHFQNVLEWCTSLSPKGSAL